MSENEEAFDVVSRTATHAAARTAVRRANSTAIGETQS